MKNRGFTIVELLVVITIMGILLTLGVVNLQDTQIGARDSERKADVESIAIHLDIFYKTGTNDNNLTGRYPSTSLASSGPDYIKQLLRDIDLGSVKAPGITNSSLTFIPATNNIQTTIGVTPQPTFDQYVYQPIKSNGTLCTVVTDECRKFNIFYRLELDNTVYSFTGKNQ